MPVFEEKIKIAWSRSEGFILIQKKGFSNNK
jgi:hypothetical protein